MFSCFEFSIFLFFQTQTLDNDSENLNEDEESNVLEDINKDIQKVIKLPWGFQKFFSFISTEIFASPKVKNITFLVGALISDYQLTAQRYC